MRTIGLLAAAVILFTAAVGRWRLYRQTRQLPPRELALALTWLALAMIIFLPAVYKSLDREIFHRPNVAELVGHLCIAFSAASAVGMVFVMSPDRTALSIWGRRALLGASVIAMAGTFLAHSYPIETVNFTTVYGGTASVQIYWAIFLTYVVLTLIHLVVLCLRVGRDSDDFWLRFGLRVVAAGAIVGLVYLMHWAWYLLAQGTDDTVPAVVMTGSQGLAALAGVVVVAGVLLPRTGKSVEERRQLAIVAPLSRHLLAVYPEATSDPVPQETHALKVYRHLVEIRDALAIARVRRDDRHPGLVHDLSEVPAGSVSDIRGEVKRLGRVSRAHRSDLNEAMYARTHA